MDERNNATDHSEGLDASITPAPGLWEPGRGNVDDELLRLEELLGRYRYVYTPLCVDTDSPRPDALTTRSPRRALLVVAGAIAAAVTLFALSGVIDRSTGSVDNVASVEQQSAARDERETDREHVPSPRRRRGAGHEQVAAPPAGAGTPERSRLLRASAKDRDAAASACREHAPGSVVDVAINISGATGTVDELSISGARGEPLQACIRRYLTRTQYPKFAARAFVFRATLRLPELPEKPSQDELREAISTAERLTQEHCAALPRPSGDVTVKFTIDGASGAPRSVSVSGVDESLKSCMKRQYQQVRFKPFRRDSFSYTMRTRP